MNTKDHMIPDSELKMKIVGRRTKRKTGLEAVDALQRLMIELRSDKPFIPKGVYRFKTFEEAQLWSLKMMTRRPKVDRPQ